MKTNPTLDDETRAQLHSIISSAMVKLKTSMDDGPGGQNAELTPEESAMLYRALTEVFGIRI